MYGLRFYTKSITLGTTFDFFVPDSDMPEAKNSRGNELIEDVNVTPFGNTWLYEKGKIGKWKQTYDNVTTQSMLAITHCVEGWYKQQQITIVAFGTLVSGTATPLGSLESIGQIWGTCYLRFSKPPEEEILDLWNFDLEITKFGTNQIFI
jgi:hypothetical protein